LSGTTVRLGGDVELAPFSAGHGRVSGWRPKIGR
jgi:hypothetical protein